MIYELEKVCFAYRGGKDVLHEASLQLEPGDMLTLLGRNGCGKTTLFGCMLGLLTPRSGRVILDGTDVSHLSPRQLAAKVSFVPQSHTPAFDYTVLEFVLMGCAAGVGILSHPGREEYRRAHEALERMELEALAQHSVSELSGGECQQAAIARAIAGRPKAILFDEPTAHLDAGNQIKVLRMIRDLSQDGYAVAVSTHEPNHALLLGSRSAVLDGSGGIVQGETERLLTQERLQTLYGTDLRLMRIEGLERDVCICPRL